MAPRIAGLIVCSLRLRSGWILVLALLFALPASSHAKPYDRVVRGKVSIDYLWSPDGMLAGLEGAVESKASVCGFSRPVLVRASLTSGHLARYWTITQIFDWELVDTTEPGRYRARIRPVVRFDQVKGERVSILCKGDFSKRLVLPDYDSVTTTDGGFR